MCIIPENDEKAMVVVAGRAFRLSEVELAHACLDQLNVPRAWGGYELSLPERINWLHGRLVSAEYYIALVGQG